MGEAATAAGISVALGILAGPRPLVAVVVLLLLGAGLGLATAGLSLAAGAVGFLALGHLASGSFYVSGVLPEAFALLLDLTLVGLFLVSLLRPVRTARMVHALALAFLALAGLQIFNPLLPSIGYGVTGFRQLAYPVLALLALKQLDLGRRDVGFILGTLAMGWLFNVGLALRQWLGGFTPAEIAWIEAGNSTYLVEDQIRLMGATQGNQDFAFLAAIALAAVTALSFRAHNPRQRVGGALLVLVSLTVLFGSLVRSGLVGGVIGATLALAVSAVTAADVRRLLTIGVVVTVGLWAAAGLLPSSLLGAEKAETLESRVSSIFAPGEDYAFQQRQTTVWPRALETIASKPWGGGAGSAGPLSQARADEAPFGALVPDNGYLLVTVQMGLAGGLLFIALLARLLLDLGRGARAGGRYAAAGFGAVTAAMLAMIAGNYWSLVAPGVVLGVIAGLGLREAGSPPQA